MPTTIGFVTDLGVNSVLLRSVSRERSRLQEAFGEALVIKILLSTFFLLALFLVVELIGFPSEISFLTMVWGMGVAVIAFGETTVAIYRGLEKFSVDATFQLLRNCALLGLIYFGLLSHMTLGGLVFGTVIMSASLTLLILIYYLRSYKISIKKVSVIQRFALLKEAWPFAVLNFVTPLFFQLNVIMLSKLSSYESVGLYNAPFRIVMFCFAVPMAFRRALFPTLTSAFTGSVDQFRRLVTVALKAMFLLGVPMAVGLYCVAEDLVRCFFPVEYQGSASALRVMAFSVPFEFLRQIVNVALFSSGHERKAVGILAVGTLLAVAINLVFIPKWDYLGACLSILIAQLVVLAMGTAVLKAELWQSSWKLDWPFIAKVSAAGAAIWLAVPVAKSLGLLAQISSGALAFLAVAFAANLPREFGRTRLFTRPHGDSHDYEIR